MLVRHRYSSTPTFNRNLDLDRAFEQLTNSFFDTRRTAAPANGPSVEGAWHDAEFVLTVDLPGVPAEAVSVDVTGTTLVLGAQTDSMEWERTVRLGGDLDPAKVTARHLDGRLTVRIGTVDAPEPRNIEIDTTPAPAAIEVTSDDSDDRSTESQSTDTSSAG